MNQENIILVTNREQYFRGMGWEKFANLQDVLFQLDFVSEIQADLETGGLSSYLVTPVNSIQIGIPGTQFVFDLHSISGGLSAFKKTLEGKLVIGHNLLFDFPYLYQAGIVPRNVWDTFIGEEILYRGLPVHGGVDRFKNLADTLRRHLNAALDKSMQEHISEGLISVEAIQYAGRDVIYLSDLMESQRKAAAARQLERSIALENRYLPMMAYLEFSGVYIDQDALYKFIRKSEALEWIAEQKMISTYGDINWGSPKQVGEILKQHGIEEYTETGTPKTDEETLQKYDIQIAKDLLELRGHSKKVSTYGRKWAHYILPDGRIHTKFKQFTETGRTSCGSTDNKGKKFHPLDVNWTTDKKYPNIQNIPRDSEHRAIFAAPKGSVLISCDYGSQESVILAELSGDEALIQFFETGGGDIHSFVTRFINPELAHLSLEEIARDHADIRSDNKRIIYAFAYGGNAKTAHDNTGIPYDRCKEVEDKYFTLFSGLKPYTKRCFETAIKLGYMPIDPLTGGKRFFEKHEEFRLKYKDRAYWDKYWEEKRKGSKWYKVESEKLGWFHALKSDLQKLAVSTKIQGTAASCSKLAGIYLFDWIVDSGNFGKVLVPIFGHDSYVAECKVKMKDLVAEKMQWAMELAGTKFLKRLKLKAVPKISQHWTK